MNRPDPRFEKWYAEEFRRDPEEVAEMWNDYHKSYISGTYNIELCWIAWCASRYFR